MAADTGGAAARGEVSVGQKRSIITAAETNVLKTTPGKLASITIANVGTTATLDIYDTAAADTTNKVYEWVSADGKRTEPVQIPMKAGIRVVSGGTFGRAVIVWS